jgi:hypothetical protein
MLKFSKNIFFSKKDSFVKENEASFGIFENILFVEMESSKLINYLTETQRTCYSTTVLTTLVEKWVQQQKLHKF